MNELASLVARCDWLALATLAENGAPAASYVPFAVVESAFAVAVSRLAAHTRNLQACAVASVLLVDDSAAQHDPFARPRLSVEVRAVFVERDSARSRAIWKALTVRLGTTVATLQSLRDFETVLLAPSRGRIVRGFAAATDIDAAALQATLYAAAER